MYEFYKTDHTRWCSFYKKKRTGIKTGNFEKCYGTFETVGENNPLLGKV
jgi:hypothetical protein